MQKSVPRGATKRLYILTALVAVIAATIAALAGPPSEASSVKLHKASASVEARKARPSASLNSVGDKYVNAAFTVKGYANNQSRGRHKLVLQRKLSGATRWSAASRKMVRNGAYAFSTRASRVGTARFRTVLYNNGRIVDYSNVISVKILRRPVAPPPTCASNPGPTTCPKPASFTDRRTITTSVDCDTLVAQTIDQQQQVNWVWSNAEEAWVQSPAGWANVPGSEGTRAAIADEDCVPAGAMLPDIRIKDLTKCGAGDMAATNGTCFKIEETDDTYSDDFPSLWNRKLLKFGVITLNVGDGPGEVVASRSTDTSTDWVAHQTFYDAAGNVLGRVWDPDVTFYFAGDGHNHWHARDFDNYTLTHTDGSPVEVTEDGVTREVGAEKHGYCMQDNTTWDPFQGLPGVSPVPVYTEALSCGKGLQGALTIIHGLSKGWGDTYPTTLPDQAIDITGVPDGEYVVTVHADAVHAVIETDDANNTTSVHVRIEGDTVTVVPGTSVGGL